MRVGFREIIANADTEVEYVCDLVKELSTLGETRILWRVWAGILDHYVKAVSAMRRATDQGSSKAWSDQLLYQQKNDPILHYAFQARDNANHIFEGKREVNARTVSIGNFISLSGNSSVTMENNVSIGSDGVARMLPNGTLIVDDGRYVGGTIPRSRVFEKEHYLVLADVTNRSGIWRIPNPHTSPEKRALEIAEYLGKWLKTCLSEAKQHASREVRPLA